MKKLVALFSMIAVAYSSNAFAQSNIEPYNGTNGANTAACISQPSGTIKAKILAITIGNPMAANFASPTFTVKLNDPAGTMCTYAYQTVIPGVVGGLTNSDSYKLQNTNLLYAFSNNMDIAIFFWGTGPNSREPNGLLRVGVGIFREGTGVFTQ